MKSRMDERKPGNSDSHPAKDCCQYTSLGKRDDFGGRMKQWIQNPHLSEIIYYVSGCMYSMGFFKSDL